VLFLLFFYAVNFAASGIVQSIYMFNNPEFVSSLLNSFSGNTTDSFDTMLDAAMDVVAGSMDGNVLGLMSIIGMVAGGCVFLIPRKKRFFADVTLPAAEPLTAKIFIILVLISQGFQGVYGLIITLIDSLLPGGLSILESYGAVMENLYNPVGFIYIILIGPIFEELIFRGAVQGTLRRFGENFAILFSALLFGLYHMLILQIPFGFVLGLLLGYAASRWSLRASIALHIAINGLSVLASLAEQETAIAIITIVMYACAAAVVIMGIRWRGALKARIRAGASNAAYYEKTYIYGFSSIAFWVFAIAMTTIGLVQMGSISLL
jgi:membrane protease YdiL (CAAX protease family)